MKHQDNFYQKRIVHTDNTYHREDYCENQYNIRMELEHFENTYGVNKVTPEILSLINLKVCLDKQRQLLQNMITYPSNKSLRMSDGVDRIEFDLTKPFILDSMVSSLKDKISVIEQEIDERGLDL